MFDLKGLAINHHQSDAIASNASALGGSWQKAQAGVKEKGRTCHSCLLKVGSFASSFVEYPKFILILRLKTLPMHSLDSSDAKRRFL